jgi:hypothetical protein
MNGYGRSTIKSLKNGRFAENRDWQREAAIVYKRDA